MHNIFNIDPNNLITNPIETQRAFLVMENITSTWKKYDAHIMAELWNEDGKTLFRYLNEKYNYISMPFGRENNLTKAIDILSHRMIPKKRTDYEDYMNVHGISKSHNLSDLSLLSYTGARLTRDSYAIYESFDGFKRKFPIYF